MADFVQPLRIIIYCGDKLKQGDKILSFVRKRSPQSRTARCLTLHEFTEALKQPGAKLFLIAIRSEDELEEILLLKDWLEGQPIIMILPDEQTQAQPHLMTRAMRLYPRYISNSRSEFSDVRLVLEKILHNYNHEGIL
tara:strand:+ start:53 stop:466 length:414 start_codon:yes stop_codon:yes gene_type:complete